MASTIPEILWFLAQDAFARVFTFMGTTGPGMFLVPLCGAIIGWFSSKPRWSMKALRHAFIDALGAVLLAFICVFSYQSYRSFRHFSNPKMNVIASLLDGNIDSSKAKKLPNADPGLPLTFKPSPLLTGTRQRRISETIRDFRLYLIRVGFTVPPQVPPIGVGNSSTIYGISPGERPDMPEDYNIILSEKDADETAKIRSLYSLYVFQALFGSLRIWPALAKNAGNNNAFFVAFLFSNYYTFSYSNHYVEENPKAVDRQWLNALRSIREKYGKQFADEAMYYCYKKWRPPDPQEDVSFNKFFSLRFLDGVGVEVSAPQQYIEIQNIYAAQGLP